MGFLQDLKRRFASKGYVLNSSGLGRFGSGRTVLYGPDRIAADAPMRKGDVRAAFLAELAPHLPGMRMRKSTSDFVRKIPIGEQCLGFGIADYNPLFSVGIFLTYRIDAVEEIVAPFAGGTEGDEMRSTITFLDYFDEHAARSMKVRTLAAVPNAVADIAAVLENKLGPFLIAHEDLVSLDAVMNASEGPTFDIGNSPYRDMNAVAIAWLAGNPRFEDLAGAAQRRAVEQAWHSDDRAKLTALVDHLRGRRRDA